MRYEYVCVNKDCPKYEEAVEILHSINTKPTVICKECGKVMSRVWTAPTIKTGDGTKYTGK